MLQLKNIKKTYTVGDIQTKALDDISVTFREKEFVAILGTSGSGKTTCLNIIGGLDRYDSGDLIIKGKRTKDFKEKDWDAYRNNSVGFVFQSYNLITHLSIVDNVEMGMTLSGVSAHEKHKRALEVLEEVGLKDHLHKKPNQLSGGQMQRVAIARALANDPEILLCDEPTGALDTTTSVQIMDLIKKVSKDRLVIMVTHNPELAEKYADRIIKFQDGKIVSDTNEYHEEMKDTNFSLKKTSMSFFTALKLSFNNIKTKKGRTFLTAFASSIGIIGIAVILSLSTGFQKQIDLFQRETMAEFPIIMSQTTAQMDMETMNKIMEEKKKFEVGTEEYANSDKVYLYNPDDYSVMHTNVFTQEYMDYLYNINPEICDSIGVSRIVQMNMLRDMDGQIISVQMNNVQDNMEEMSGSVGMSSMGISSYPKSLQDGGKDYLKENYDVLAGEYPSEKTDLVLVIDDKNRIDLNVLKNLGFETDNIESIKFDDIVGTKFKIISNDNFYQKTPYGNFVPNDNYEEIYNKDGNIEVQIVGVVRPKKDVSMGMLTNGIAYSDELSEMVIESAQNSEIVEAQRNSDKNVINMEVFKENEKEQFMSYLGGNSTPYMIMVYPNSFESKELVLNYLDDYNNQKSDEDKIVYSDLAGTMSDMTSGIMGGITIVLIAFAGVSLVVSLIMICIITYTSVLERTKEIGILKALGARKKDISRVFDAETCILGVFSGVLGVVIAWGLTFPINSIIYSMTELKGASSLNPIHAILLVLISTVLTMLGGHIPAKMAAKKDAVEALRSQ